ncbi:MAG: Fe-S cluster assembly protein SufD [Salinivirgaceae bacterium]|jgi:Fe-S cluster assembly protein SufD|nr:Fe-S cluster assembly protein SufD [Salinivirgaceae bacterium]
MSDLNTKYQELIADNLENVQKHSSLLLNSIRSEAQQNFGKEGLPTLKNEAYKYTNLLPLYNMDWKLPELEENLPIDISNIFSCDVPNLDTDLVLTINGRFYEFQGSAENLPEGTIIGGLAKMSEKYPKLVKAHLFKQMGDKTDGITSLNGALAVDGLFIYIPKNAVFEKPIQIVNILMGDKPLLTHKRNLIIADENAQSQIVICDHTLSAERFFDNSVTEVVVKQNAQLEYYNIQNQHNDSSQLCSLYSNVHRDATFHISTISLHGGLIRNNLHISLLEEGAHADASGLSLTDRHQHVDNHTYIDHKAPQCTSNQFFKSVLDDQSTTVFTGRIMVQPDAQQTKAYQSNKSLLLTDDASSNSRPQLEIYADDVKCSHGATTGQIDEDALFYMQQRGINQREAKLLLMYAFAFEIIEKIKVKPLADRIQDLVNKRLRGELSRCNNCEIHCQ